VLPIEDLAKALKRRSSCAPLLAHGRPACEHTHAPDAAAPTASHPTFVTIAKRPLCPENLAECANGRLIRNLSTSRSNPE
jgi:hypothetical protein